jgi:hypothetical protein
MLVTRRRIAVVKLALLTFGKSRELCKLAAGDAGV